MARQAKEGRSGWHEGQITPNKHGTYNWRVRVTYPDGSTARPSGTARNMTEARAAVRRAQEEASAGQKPLDSGLTVGEMVGEYMEGKAQDWAQRTLWNNQHLYTHYIAQELGQLKAAGVDPPRLRLYFAALQRRGLGDSGRRQIHSLLSGAYKRAISDGRLRDNPTLHAKAGKTKDTAPKLKHFTPEELRRFIEAARADRWALPLAFIGMTGLRIGEALGLTWADIKQDEQGAAFVQIDKTRSSFQGKAYTSSPKTAKGRRRVYLHPEALEVLEEMRGHIALEIRIHGKVWAGDTGPLFPSALSGDFLRQDSARAIMRRTCERAGVPLLSPHALRHSAGTYLISQGVDPVSVSALLGHAQVSTTLNIYAHALPDKLRGLVFGVEDLRAASLEGKAAKEEETAPPAGPTRAPALGRKRKGGPRPKVSKPD